MLFAEPGKTSILYWYMSEVQENPANRRTGENKRINESINEIIES